jgi:subtilisin family serine protease
LRSARSPRRLLAVLTAAATAAAVVTASTPAAAASAAAPSAVTAAPATITLITGDTVTVARDSAGHTSVDVTPHPGDDAFTYSTQQDDDGYYLIPDDAASFVASGVLDRQLFNLNYLAANGYADNATKAVPVIVQYQLDLGATELDRKAGALPGNSDRRSLPSLDATALDVAKDQAGAFWDTVRGQNTRSALGAGVRKVWLDRKVTVLDDVSNEQIGAPTAWRAGLDGTGATVGIIDTGVDSTHPDLAGKVVAAHNFVEAGFPGGGAPDNVTDGHGHGTHVASIIAGSGAASGGKYQGVAPGAHLVIAKALDNTGSGTSSAIIAAMEWEAATEQVDVVSMSLGSGPTDGTDPLSTAVNELSAQYGTLFVIAAGNSGPGDFTVAAPGAATAALTVGAVDSHDKIADFSSRGPRIGDLAIKPEITAPGVGIIAARAAGTSLGTPLNDRYTAASGTSMATPHVAAAAGILAAAHRDWTPEQLKTALVGTAADGGLSAYEQGAGRLDIGRAATQSVFDDVATISAKVSYPYDGKAVTKTVTYRNAGTSPVTLDLSATLTHDGSPAPAGMAKVDKSSVTVEPGATASIDLTLDPAVAVPGWYDGKLTASDGTNHLTVPVALWLQAEQHMVRLQLVGDPGWLSMNSIYANAILMSDTDPRFAGEPVSKLVAWHATDKPNTLEATVPLARGGTYALSTNLLWYKADHQLQYGQIVNPEITVDGDRTVVLDATKLARVNVTTEQPSEAVMASYFYYQTATSGTLYTGGAVLSNPTLAAGGYWISPAKKPAIGTLGFLADETRIAPQVSLTVPGLSLHPRYVTDRAELVPKFTADQRVGFANEQDLRAGKDVRGKLVFLTPAPLATLQSDLDLATAHGAAGVLTSNYLARLMYSPPLVDTVKIPLLVLDSGEAARLGAKLPKSAALHAQVTSPYEYKSVYYLRDGIPTKVDLTSRDRDLAKVDTTYHARFAPKQGKWGPIAAFTEVQHTYVPGQNLSIRGSHEFIAPTTRTEYYTVPGDDVTWNRDYRFFDATTGGERYAGSYRGFTRGSTGTEDWNETALPMQALAGKDLPATGQVQLICDTCRQGDRLRLRSLGALGLGQFADASDPTHQYMSEPGTEEVHLYREGTEVAPSYDSYGLPSYEVPAGSATYRLSDVYTDGFAAPHGGTTVTTDWTFRSSRPKEATVSTPYACIDTVLFNVTEPCAWQPLIQLSYDLDVAADDTARAGRPFDFTVRARTGAAKPIALRDLKVWISADGGTHWTRTTVTRGKDNAYRVAVTNPRGAGSVTIKTEATDRDGNSVRQTVVDAYPVR